MNYTIFGESHGPAIGVVLEDVPSGLALDLEQIAFELGRRAPGKSPLSTPRKEADQPEVLSGVFEGKTTGTPLCAIIRNSDQHSGDYAAIRDLARPGHADYTGRVRYQGFQDYRGGGHFSGRLTAPLVFAGAVAKQILAQRGITVGAHISQIEHVKDTKFAQCIELNETLFSTLAHKAFPTLSDETGEQMQQAILTARSEQDSVGGVIECAVVGLDPGVGAPDFGRNVEGILAQHLFAVPAVKGIAFGAGFDCAEMRGSVYNDTPYMDAGQVKTKTNYNGGVNGGITNGMPVVFEVAIRPTPSISRPQQTVNMAEGVDAEITIQGRHDPCVVHRAVPVIEAAAALAICQLLEEV
jgi:chorismate synthase